MNITLINEHPHIYSIPVPLPRNPLRNLNVYVIVDSGDALVIDTGFNCSACKTAFLQGLQEIGLTVDNCSLFLSHLHSDHTGLSDLFTVSHRPIYMSREDIPRVKKIVTGDQIYHYIPEYSENGFPSDVMAEAIENSPIYCYAPSLVPEFTVIEDGDVLRVGTSELICILTPGHTPGHMCLFLEKKGILFAGDHILYDITPNIGIWENVDDTLGDYLSSLNKILKVPFADALPAHRQIHKYGKERIIELKMHHRNRLAEAFSIIKQDPGKTVYSAASKMTWSVHQKPWGMLPASQKWFATGEAISHMNWLRLRGFIKCARTDNNLLYYYAADNKSSVHLESAFNAEYEL